jgi:hypothetical protein
MVPQTGSMSKEPSALAEWRGRQKRHGGVPGQPAAIMRRLLAQRP